MCKTWEISNRELGKLYTYHSTSTESFICLSSIPIRISKLERQIKRVACIGAQEGQVSPSALEVGALGSTVTGVPDNTFTLILIQLIELRQ